VRDGGGNSETAVSYMWSSLVRIKFVIDEQISFTHICHERDVLAHECLIEEIIRAKKSSGLTAPEILFHLEQLSGKLAKLDRRLF
jgi:hypothetical protein